MVASRSRMFGMVRVAMIPGPYRRNDDSSGMNAAREAHAAHHAIQQAARQIATVLRSEDEEEQDQDLRQEHQHAADAGDDAVDQQAAQNAVGQPVPQRAGQHADAAMSIHSIGTAAQENTAWNIKNSSVASTGAATGRSTTASMRGAGADARGARIAADGEDAAPHATPRRPADIGDGIRGRRSAAAPGRGCAARYSASSSVGGAPATVSTTGTPSSRESAIASTCACERATSRHVQRDDHRPEPFTAVPATGAQVQGAGWWRIDHGDDRVLGAAGTGATIAGDASSAWPG